MTAITDAVALALGLTVHGELELARRLEPAEGALEAALERVTGREQMTVRIYERHAGGEEGARRAAPAHAGDLGPALHRSSAADR